MKPDDEDYVLTFIRTEHREWRKGVDDWRRLVDERLGGLIRQQDIETAVRAELKEHQLDAEYKTQSGSWDGPAVQALTLAALQQHLQQRKQSSRPPPAPHWLVKVFDTAVGKAVTVATSILVGGLLQYLLTHWPR